MLLRGTGNQMYVTVEKNQGVRSDSLKRKSFCKTNEKKASRLKLVESGRGFAPS